MQPYEREHFLTYLSGDLIYIHSVKRNLHLEGKNIYSSSPGWCIFELLTGLLSTYPAFQINFYCHVIRLFVFVFDLVLMADTWCFCVGIEGRLDPIVLGFASSSPLCIRYNLQNKTAVDFFRLSSAFIWLAWGTSSIEVDVRSSKCAF